MSQEVDYPGKPGGSEGLNWFCSQGNPVPFSNPGYLLPGSFNPLHQAHIELFRLAGKILNKSGAFEITLQNVDKPVLSDMEFQQRLAQFRGLAPVVATRAGSFLAKARLFPGTVFVVGADTALRIFDLRFYQQSRELLYLALEEIGSLGCSFLVAGRANPEGDFLSLTDLPVPLPFKPLFTGIPPDVFRIDISSTLLRQQSEVRP